jgi:hypothetical protein
VLVRAGAGFEDGAPRRWPPCSCLELPQGRLPKTRKVVGTPPKAAAGLATLIESFPARAAGPAMVIGTSLASAAGPATVIGTSPASAAGPATIIGTSPAGAAGAAMVIGTFPASDAGAAIVAGTPSASAASLAMLIETFRMTLPFRLSAQSPSPNKPERGDGINHGAHGDHGAATHCVAP